MDAKATFINKIKQFRRVFSRFEKLASRYLGFLWFASVVI
jgi:transposase